MIRLLLLAMALSLALPGVLPADDCAGTVYGGHVPCCKYCTKGKACGDTCIARSKTCRVGHGCACNAGLDLHPAAMFYGASGAF
jgi:hypothetical protein